VENLRSVLRSAQDERRLFPIPSAATPNPADSRNRIRDADEVEKAVAKNDATSVLRLADEQLAAKPVDMGHTAYYGIGDSKFRKILEMTFPNAARRSSFADGSGICGSDDPAPQPDAPKPQADEAKAETKGSAYWSRWESCPVGGRTGTRR
jgi:hypothetical protein